MLILLLGLFSGQSFAADALLKGDSQRVRVNKLLGNIHWHQSLAQAQADARSRNKMIFWVNILGRLDRDTWSAGNSLRAVSLSQDPAYSALKNYFVCGFKDITHESYSGMSGRHTTFGNAVNTTNGAGPRNLQLFMLSSDGTVLHCLPGYWNSRDLVYEMIFAAQLDEVYKDRSLGAREKAERFRAMQLAHAAQHPKQMSNRSHMQGFDQQYEAKNRLNESDTIRDVNAVKAALRTDAHIPGYAFKTTDVLLHERMASRPFVHYSRFDVAKFSDYGKPIYDKNEDQRDVRTGETIVHNGHKDLIGNPIALAKQKYGKKWRNYVDDPSSAKGWGENTAGAGQGAWSDSGQQSRAKSWGEYQGQGSLWGQQNDSQKKKKGR